MAFCITLCPLCLQAEMLDYFEDKQRSYHHCQNCDLVSVPATYHLDAAAEKAEYDKHQNDPNNPGYRQFLGRAVHPLLDRLNEGARGLDFGCGPGPAISRMAEELGFHMANYDPLYFNQPAVLNRKYDFITMTEVIEHLADPINTLNLINKMLNQGAILAIMTKRVQGLAAFARWHYKNDPTHIAFYSEKVFSWLAEHFGWRLEIIDKDVVFFHKD